MDLLNRIVETGDYLGNKSIDSGTEVRALHLEHNTSVTDVVSVELTNWRECARKVQVTPLRITSGLETRAGSSLKQAT